VNSKTPDKPQDPRRSDFGIFLILGTTLAAWMTAGVLAGRYVDVRFGIAPWGLISGALLGIAGSGYSVFQASRKLNSDKNS
jgi:F0F1-type ATP synthase assembly protein I